jgi:TetR/AcrR family transcriptional regulator
VLGPRGNRAIAKILDATRQIFLVRGYGGTTIDDITGEAGVSRASFYTYFPTKRDVLLTLGADASVEAGRVMAELHELPAGWTVDDVVGWIERYFELMEVHGSFSFAWTQAAHEDEELRVAGMHGHLNLCRRLGEALASLGAPADHADERGLIVFSMLERTWAYCQLYSDEVDLPAIHRRLAEAIAAFAR